MARETMRDLRAQVDQLQVDLEDANRRAELEHRRFLQMVDGAVVRTMVMASMLTSLEDLARQLIDGGGYSTPDHQRELLTAESLLLSHGVDVRRPRPRKDDGQTEDTP